MSFLASPVLTAEYVASALGVGLRTVQIAFKNSSEGRPYKGEILPVVQVPGQKGGKGGMVWALHLDGCSPALRAKLCPPERTDLTPVESPVKV